MVTEIYIKALLADERLADMVWELLELDIITEPVAVEAWLYIQMIDAIQRKSEVADRHSASF